jgi:hypothetical protein
MVRRVGIEATALSQNSSRKQTKQGHYPQLASQDLGASPGLQEIIDSWPTLSPEIRVAVVAIVKSVNGDEKS